MDYSPLLRAALRAIRLAANVRFGILPSQSGFRRNDGEGRTRSALPKRSRHHTKPRLNAPLEIPAMDGRIWTTKPTQRSEFPLHAPERRSGMIAKATASSAMAVRIERP